MIETMLATALVAGVLGIMIWGFTRVIKFQEKCLTSSSEQEPSEDNREH